MERGYVKLWRKSIDGGWLSNHKLWVFWCWCLMKASYKEHDLVVGYQKVHLMAGDFVFGLNNASEELNISVQSIRTILDFLKTSGNITIKSTNKFSVISLVNWQTYQSQENEINTQINKPLTNNQQTTNNKQERKERKEGKENTSVDLEFELFYENYPRKDSKKQAKKAWDKLNGSKPDVKILIEKSNDMLTVYRINNPTGTQYLPMASTWLNNSRWEDEIEIAKKYDPYKGAI